MRPRLSLVVLLLVDLAFVGCKEPKPSPPATQPRAEAQPRRAAYVVIPGKKPVEAIKRVLIVTLDGLRPDLLLRANMPNVRGMMSQGTFTFWARTIEQAETLPSHTSIVTGVSPEKHGIRWNYHVEDTYPQVPTIFERAKQAGYTTALVTGKTKFVALRKPGTIDWAFVPGNEPNPDEQVAAEAIQIIREHHPDVMLLHFPNPDDLGHWYGWGSPQHIAIIEKADQAVGRVLDCLRMQNLLDSTCLILTADHGGQGYSHWGGDERSRYIPWIAVGPGIRRNFDLTLLPNRQVKTQDTFATACALLAIPYGPEVEGEPVFEMLESSPAVPPSPYLDHEPAAMSNGPIEQPTQPGTVEQK